ncbi:MAG: formate dehydrogenase accessory sulfurtransferase FdhD [Bacteroidales bacterium]
MKTIQLTKLTKAEFIEIEDIIAEEVDFIINTGKNQLLKLICTPEALEEMVVGHLFTSAFIDSMQDIISYKIDYETFICECNLVDKKSGLKIGNSRYTIHSTDILRWMDKFTHYSEKFQQTGCFHSAAIVENNEIIAFYDDIGRHNAIDKIIGKMLLDKKSLADKVLLTTGRMPVEILKKIVRSGIKTIISKAPPTYQSVLIGKQHDITIIGFARTNTMNIYSGKQRIII